jgi:glyoxylase-like metal-dependent hydrolase (beta-lactamase superfamily II)
MKRVILLGVLLAVGCLCVAVMGYQGPPAGGQGGAGGRGGAPQALRTIKVRDNLFMIANGGENTGVFITSAGVVLVDTKNPNNGPGIMDQVKMLTNKPVTMVINTHTHADHTGSNEYFTDNVVFVAHENTKTNMEKMTNFAGDKARFLPSRTFKDTMTIGSGADQIVLYYFGRAHTSGDAFVVFPALRAMHAGDAFASKGTPLIDVPNGGSAVEYGQTLAKAAATIKNVDTIINGHITTGPTSFEDLRTYADFNNDFLAFVKDEMKASKTAEEAAADYKVPDKYLALGYAGGGGGGAGRSGAAGGANPAAGARGGAAGGRGALGGGVAGNIRTAYTELGK